MSIESLTRRLARPLLVLIAALFLVEAWLWDRLAPVIGKLVAALPLEYLKRWMARRIGALSPYGALVVFLSPLSLGIPVKCLEVWLLMHHHWIAVIGLFVAAKLMGVGMLAFIFDATREKLLSIGWFKAIYEGTMRAYQLSHALVAPIKAGINHRLAKLRDKARGELACFVKRLRRRSLAAWRACSFTQVG
ncbi:hypothetical protein ACVIGB_000783 [Bradyrhizobium sp. USDA 4341]